MTSHKPFRFGLATDTGATHTVWRDKARKAEDMGFDALLVPDHVTNDLAPLAALAVAAEATTTLRIGSFVFRNDFRHPVMLAHEAATLDLLSEGRFELGLGAGYDPNDYSQSGIPFDPPGVRLNRLEESLHIILQFFTQETVNFAGQYYTVSGLRSFPRLVQRPHPPIFIGGKGRRLLSLGARLADGLGVGFQSIVNVQGRMAPTTPDAIEEKINWIREAAGERFEHLELGYTLFHVQVTDQSFHAPLNFHVMMGSQEQIIEQLLERRERYALTYVQVTDQAFDLFAPIVARLAEK